MSSAAPDRPAQAGTLLDPLTGEVIAISAGLDELAAFRDRLGELKRTIDATLVDLDAEVTARLDLDNTRSARAGVWELVTEAPLTTVWDTPRLGIALEALVAAGKITRPAAEAALEAQPIVYKPRARELAKLLAHADPDVVEAVEACRRAEPRYRRRVTVKRIAPPQRRLSGAQTPQEGTP